MAGRPAMVARAAAALVAATGTRDAPRGRLTGPGDARPARGTSLPAAGGTSGTATAGRMPGGTGAPTVARAAAGPRAAARLGTALGMTSGPVARSRVRGGTVAIGTMSAAARRRVRGETAALGTTSAVARSRIQGATDVRGARTAAALRPPGRTGPGVPQAGTGVAAPPPGGTADPAG